MGGALSGYRWHKKRVVENCHALDTADLKRLTLLTPSPDERTGVLRWTRRGESVSAVNYAITVGAGTGTLRLSYRRTKSDEDVAYPVELVSTPCHLGGVRWWFVCPLLRDVVPCGRRARKLYLSGRYFGCRRCHSLSYASTQQSDARVYAALRRGIDFAALDDMSGLSVGQLGFALKVLTFAEKRLDRLGKRGRGRTPGAA